MGILNLKFRMNKITNPETIFKEQMRRIKYDILESRPDGNDEGFNDEEYRKLRHFMRQTARDLMKLRQDEPMRPITQMWAPVLRLKTITFIKENLPNYSKRLRRR